MAKLTQQQEMFCELYAGGMSGVRAYAQAYGIENLTTDDPKYAAIVSNASRLLKKENVHNRVIELQKEIYNKLCINPEKVAIKLSEMAFADKDDTVYTPAVQQKALDMLQKQLGLQKQKMDIDSTQTINVTVEEE